MEGEQQRTGRKRGGKGAKKGVENAVGCEREKVEEIEEERRKMKERVAGKVEREKERKKKSVRAKSERGSGEKDEKEESYVGRERKRRERKLERDQLMKEIRRIRRFEAK